MTQSNSKMFKYGGAVFAGLGGLEAIGIELIHQYNPDAGSGYTLFLTQGICMGIWGLAGIAYGKYLDNRSRRETQNYCPKLF